MHFWWLKSVFFSRISSLNTLYIWAILDSLRKFEFASFLKTSSPLFTHGIDTWCINNEPIPIHFARQFITVIRQLTSYIIKVHSNSIVLGAKLDHAKYKCKWSFFSFIIKVVFCCIAAWIQSDISNEIIVNILGYIREQSLKLFKKIH